MQEALYITRGESPKHLKLAAGRQWLQFHQISLQTVMGGGKSVFEKRQVMAAHNYPGWFDTDVATTAIAGRRTLRGQRRTAEKQ